MSVPSRIFLVGPMGSGKSTIGRRLARTLGKRFLDTDHEITKRTGASIPLIFDLEGESGFRQRERQVLDDATSQTDVVVATGGGVILDSENRKHIRERGFTIYLRTGVEQQLSRAGGDRNRPLLRTEDPRATLESLLRTREPLYHEVADMIVDTDGRSVVTVVNRILNALTRHT